MIFASVALVSLRSVKTLVQFVVAGTANEVAAIRDELDLIAELGAAKGTSDCLLVGVEWIFHNCKTRREMGLLRQNLSK